MDFRVEDVLHSTENIRKNAKVRERGTVTLNKRQIKRCFMEVYCILSTTETVNWQPYLLPLIKSKQEPSITTEGQ